MFFTEAGIFSEALPVLVEDGEAARLLLISSVPDDPRFTALYVVMVGVWESAPSYNKTGSIVTSYTTTTIDTIDTCITGIAIEKVCEN